MSTIDLRNLDNAAHARALIALMHAGVPSRWSVNSTPSDETAMGKTLVQQAFGLCTSDLYDCVKGICRNDFGAAQKFYDIVTEDIPGTKKLSVVQDELGTALSNVSITRYSTTHKGQHAKLSVAWGIATLRLWIAYTETPVKDG